MKDEMIAFEANKTFSVVDLPPGKKAISNMWIYKIKYNADGSIERPKSRLVALGNRQVKRERFQGNVCPSGKDDNHSLSAENSCRKRLGCTSNGCT